MKLCTQEPSRETGVLARSAVRLFAAAVLLGGVTTAAQAITITPTSAFQTVGGPATTTPPQSPIGVLIDGVPNFAQWYGVRPVANSTIRFGLGGPFDLDGINIWNNGGAIPNDGEGIKDFTLNFFDAGLAAVGSTSNSLLDTLPMQTRAFTASNVSFVDLVVNSSHGRLYALLHEVNFTGTPYSPMPEPTTLAVFGLGLAALGATRRRKSSR